MLFYDHPICVWFFFLSPYFSIRAFNFFFSFCPFLPFFQALHWPPVSLSDVTVHLVPHAAYFCAWFIYSPTADPLIPCQALSYLQGGQPLGRIDRPCKSFGCCNKISSSWDLWGQMHVEEETPTVYETVTNAKCIDRRKRCPNSWQFILFCQRGLCFL